MPGTSATFDELVTALRERLAVIRDRAGYEADSAAHLERLKAASEKIEAAISRLPAGVDPQLAHYLQRSSYEKALAFLETQEA
jgi:hypothetical protein